MSVGVIVGIVAGVILLVGIILAIVIIIRKQQLQGQTLQGDEIVQVKQESAQNFGRKSNLKIRDTEINEKGLDEADIKSQEINNIYPMIS